MEIWEEKGILGYENESGGFYRTCKWGFLDFSFITLREKLSARCPHNHLYIVWYMQPSFSSALW